MNNENIKGVIDLKHVDTDLRSHIENIEGKGLRQQIEEMDPLTPYDGVITEEILIDFLEEINKTNTRRYIDPTEYMSQKQKQQFNSYVQESIKKAKEDGY